MVIYDVTYPFSQILVGQERGKNITENQKQANLTRKNHELNLP